MIKKDQKLKDLKQWNKKQNLLLLVNPMNWTLFYLSLWHALWSRPGYNTVVMSPVIMSDDKPCHDIDDIVTPLTSLTIFTVFRPFQHWQQAPYALLLCSP